MAFKLGNVVPFKSITETLRVCKQIRIFPIVNLDAEKTDLTTDVIRYFSQKYSAKIVDTFY